MMVQTKTHGFELAFEAFSVSNILNTAKYSKGGGGGAFLRNHFVEGGFN